MLAKPLPFLKVPLAAVRLGILALLKNCLNSQYYILSKHSGSIKTWKTALIMLKREM